MKKNSGFSLVEMMVVMTIIMVITVVASVTFTGANRRARDNRRASDLEKIRVALEMSRQVGTTYAVNLPSLVSGGFIESVPVDPKGYVYYFDRNVNGYQYQLYAQMEDLGSTNGTYSGSCGGTCNYRVGSP